MAASSQYGESVTTASFDRRDLHGPFDVIGDVHGCLGELEELLSKLGYSIVRNKAGKPKDAIPPPGRMAVFVGDIVNRGPNTVGVLRLIMGMVRQKHALSVMGNHEYRLSRRLDGQDASRATNNITVRSLRTESQKFQKRVHDFLTSLPYYLWLDDGRLIIAHAGLKEKLQGLDGDKVRAFALLAQTSGKIGRPSASFQRDWPLRYRGKTTVLYGHIPRRKAQWENNTLCLDTGCVIGGKLSALRYPEMELVAVTAWTVYARPRLT
jgi:hypothetical protein